MSTTSLVVGAAVLAAILTGCAAIPPPQPSEGLRAPGVPSIVIWRVRF